MTRRARRAWAAVALGLFALGIFGLALGTAFRGFWGADLRREVPAPSALLPDAAHPARRVPPAILADYRLGVWGVGRNAWTLLHRPLRLYDAEPCHPEPRALSLHHPLVTPALLALPVELATGEPIAAFDAAVLLQVLVGAFAMFLLVADWTRSPPAGIAAGLLYAFGSGQLGAPVHFFSTDNAWLLFALFFAVRLFRSGRLVDAAGLGAAAALQAGSSFYPLFATALAALPFSVWLLWRHRRVPVSRVALAASIAAAGAAAVLWPYLAADAAGGDARERAVRYYATWSQLLPGGILSPGWTGWLLAAAALAVPRRRSLRGMDGDPRPALVAAALLVALFATGGNQVARSFAAGGGDAPLVALPNPFEALAGLLPGLAEVRIPASIGFGARELLCVLAGIGAAGLLRLVPARARTAAAALLIAVAFLETLGPALPGAPGGPPFGRLDLAPDAAELRFFETLRERGGDGPLLEVPMRRAHKGYAFHRASEQHLLTAWHHRRSSSCYASFIPSSVRRLEALADRPGDPAALDALAAAGFETVVVHHAPRDPGGAAAAESYRRAAAALPGRLVPIASDGERTAYALRPAVAE